VKVDGNANSTLICVTPRRRLARISVIRSPDGRTVSCEVNGYDLASGVPMSDNTLNKVLQIMACDIGTGGDYCARGFRSNASTLLSKEGARSMAM
jgi:hypothetical protein